MEKIIEKLYELQLQEETSAFATENNSALKQEWLLYDYLYSDLKGDHHTAFQKYSNFCLERQQEELKIAYKNGFQTAIKLILETTKE